MTKKHSAAFAAEIAAAKAQSHWTPAQRNHLRRMIAGGALIAYWCSDAHGRPANRDFDSPLKAREWTARPGLVQRVTGPLETCSGRALHATLEPHRWRGVRVWIVALVGETKADSDHKFGSLHREIVGEVLPEEAIDHSSAARLGRKDLDGARLVGASLDGASLVGANLDGASLDGAIRNPNDAPIPGWICEKAPGDWCHRLRMAP
jgi:hypothetical protein